MPAPQWYAVYRTSDGELLSTGTVVASPLPAGFTAVPIAEPDFGRHRWNQALRLLEDWTPPTPPAVPLASDEIMAIPDIAAMPIVQRTRVRLAVKRVVP